MSAVLGVVPPAVWLFHVPALARLGQSVMRPEGRGILPIVAMAIGALIGVLFFCIVKLAIACRRRAAALELAHAELSAIHASAPVALLVVDGQLRVEKVNALAARFAGPKRTDQPCRAGEAMGCLNALAVFAGIVWGIVCRNR